MILIRVTLPNDKKTIPSKERDVHLSKKSMHNNVLYSPNLCCNFILIGQISTDLNCFVTFCDDVCALHDCTLRSLIGWMKHKKESTTLKGALKYKVQGNIFDLTIIGILIWCICQVKFHIFYLVISELA